MPGGVSRVGPRQWDQDREHLVEDGLGRRRWCAGRLLWITVAVTVFLAASLVVALATVGLRQ